MWGLEYALLFGVPNNKLELLEGKSRCAFPFRQRSDAEAHFTAWIDTLCRWKTITDPPPIRKKAKSRLFEAAGFRLELAPLPIDLRIPLDHELFRTFYKLAWRRECWPAQPQGCERGWECPQTHWDVQLHLWKLFGELCARHGGVHSGRVDIHLTPTTAVAPDQYYFKKTRKQCMIAGDYFQGTPELIAEILTPASCWIDRGPRMQLYRTAGVPWLWLLEPSLETVEVYELHNGDYRLQGVYRPGESFATDLLPGERIQVEPLFDTQEKRWRERDPEPEEPEPEPEPIAEWLAPAEQKLGLEYLLLLGHPERRFELWNNRAPCVLPFGSTAEAAHRLRQFAEDAGRWEGMSVGEPTTMAEDVEQAEVGRFRLTRRGRHVHLEVAAQGKMYRQLLEVWADHDAWDWGEQVKRQKKSG